MSHKVGRMFVSYFAALLSVLLVLSGIPAEAVEYALAEPDAVRDDTVELPADDLAENPNEDEAPSQGDAADQALPSDDDTQNDGADVTETEPVEVPTEQDDKGQAPQELPSEAQDSQQREETVTNDEDAARDTAEPTAEAQQKAPTIAVLAHVQNIGWAKSWVRDGATAGTFGRALRAEAFQIKLENLGGTSGSVAYRAHVQDEGWQGWVKDGATGGSVGKARRVEAIQIKLEGDIAQSYDVWYRVHAQDYGWMAWAKNGETAGTAGLGKRMEAIQVVLVESGGSAPSPASQNTAKAFVGKECVGVSAHVQNIGWMRAVGNGAVAGTTGRGLRLEALRASLDGARVPGGVQTQVHVQNIGWMGTVGNGAVSGTTGRGLRVEAVRMNLTGEAAAKYDLYYRVHVQDVGWLSWASEGQTAGSEGKALRIEAIQTKLVPEGAAAPTDAAAWPNPALGSLGISYATCVNGSWQAMVANGAQSGTTGRALPANGVKAQLVGSDASLGGVTYRAHMQDKGWLGWVSNGAVAGQDSAGRRMEAVQFQLTGKLSQLYNVWYRVHVDNYGWMGWTCNGGTAGTIGLARRIEAVQIKVLPKSSAAPGSTVRPSLNGQMRAGLDAAPNSRSVTPFGNFSASGAVLSRITNEVNALRGRGYDVGFIMMDLSSLKGVAYNCDGLFYGASSIKAPYIASVVSAHPDSVVRYAHDMTETLYYSWDYNYKNVLAAYGKDPMRTWCRESGARASIAESLPWADYSARDLAKLWARNYQLFSESSAGEQFGRWCERPNISTIHATLGGTYRTRSKAGWIDDGGSMNPSVNGGGQRYRVSDDGGIVYARNGAYVIAIMSSVPANHDLLNGLTAALDAAHSSM